MIINLTVRSFGNKIIKYRETAKKGNELIVRQDIVAEVLGGSKASMAIQISDKTGIVKRIYLGIASKTVYFVPAT